MSAMKREALICVLLAAVTLAVYGQVVGYDFINYDDPDYVTANPYVRAGLTRVGLSWALTTGHASNWHPVTWLSHMIDCELWGLRSGAHHLTNVVLHTGNSLLLFALLRGMTGTIWPSAAVAWLFALHPLHVESVAWVAERKDVLSTLFWMLTLLAYWHYVRRPNLERYLLVLVLLAMGLMAKPMLVTLPLVMLLLDVWPLGRLSLISTRDDREMPSERSRGHVRIGPARQVGARASRGRRRESARRRTDAASPAQTPHPLLEKIPLLGVAAASSLVTLAVQLGGGAIATVDALPLSVRIDNAIVSCVAYLQKMIIPAGLVIFYPHVPLSGRHVAGAGLILVAISAIAAWRAPRQPWLLVGWLWYLITLLPVVGLMQVGDQAMADRYTYVPLIGPFMMLAWSAKELTTRWPASTMAVGVFGGTLLAACPVITWFQLHHWRNSVTLFAHATTAIPDNYLAQLQLGNALAEQGRFTDAIAHYSAALHVKPDLAEAHGNLGALLAQEGRGTEAIAQYTEALRLNPDLPDAHSNLGAALADQGQFDLAIGHYSEALRLNPNHQAARDNLARALAARSARRAGGPDQVQ